MEDAADGLLALDFDALAADVFLFNFANDTPADTLDEPAPLFGVAGIGQQGRYKRRAARRKRPPRRPDMERRYMPVPYVLLVHGIQRRLLKRKRALDESWPVIHFAC